MVANITDPQSRVMATRRGFVQGYNAQVAVTSDQLIIAVHLGRSTNDQACFLPMMRAAQEAAARIHAATGNTEHVIGTVLADAGYNSDANITAPGPDRLIALGKDRDQAIAATHEPTQGPPPAGTTPRDANKHRLRTPEGRALCKRRGATVEPAIGNLKKIIDRFSRRGLANVTSELHLAATAWSLGPSHSYPDRPARGEVGKFPVLLNSPGMGDATGWSTAQAEDLASHGYVVVAINHTHEAFSVHFPDGRIEHTVVPLDSPQEVLRDVLLPTRVADTRFVLDELFAAASGHGSQATRALPANLATSLDLTKVGMFGHSLGGSTTVQTLHDDPRIGAGIDLDGPILGSVATEGTDKPLLMLAGGASPWYGNPGWEPYWPSNTGVKLPLQVSGTEHMSFCDQQTILPQLTTAGLLSTESTTKAVGKIGPQRSIDLQRSYLRTFFDAVFGRNNTGIVEVITALAQPELLPHP
jgi:dienelactone hydrolase